MLHAGSFERAISFTRILSAIDKLARLASWSADKQLIPFVGFARRILAEAACLDSLTIGARCRARAQAQAAESERRASDV